jgi:hypothetical protein
MLIGAAGAPSSGKTTGQLGLAYHLKLKGAPCQFIGEPARAIIDKYGLAYQSEIEKGEKKIIKRAQENPDQTYITDGGIYLGQFYGGQPYGTEDYDLVIFYDTLYMGPPDSGRKHSYEQSIDIQAKMAKFFDNQPNVVRYSRMIKPDFVLKVA